MKNKKKLEQSPKRPRKVSNYTTQEVVDGYFERDLEKGLGFVHSRDKTFIGSIFIKISPEQINDKINSRPVSRNSLFKMNMLMNTD